MMGNFAFLALSTASHAKRGKRHIFHDWVAQYFTMFQFLNLRDRIVARIRRGFGKTAIFLARFSVWNEGVAAQS
jgi:hypothetical protein